MSYFNFKDGQFKILYPVTNKNGNGEMVNTQNTENNIDVSTQNEK